MLPKPLPELRGEDAKRFIEFDKKPLTTQEKRSLQHCVKTYESIKPRRK